MRRKLKPAACLVCAMIIGALLPLNAAFSQSTRFDARPMGIFDESSDIGSVKIVGSTTYDRESQVYVVNGSGANMWEDRDEAHFVWRRMEGDFLLRSRARLVGDGGDPHRKLGLMVRSNLDSSATYVDIAVHGDGFAAMQYRRSRTGETEMDTVAMNGPDVLQIQRKGNTYTVSAARFGETFTSTTLSNLVLGQEVYVGMFVCAHNEDVVETGVFENVRLVVPVADDYTPYTDYIGSNLEVLDVATGARKILHTEDDSFQAPNWTPDGEALIYNRNGLLYRYDLERGEPAAINTNFAIRNNNDHVLSWGGEQLAISHHAADDEGRSNIYIMPVEGGTPRRVTSIGPSYLHGWSADNKFLTYTGGRDGNYDIYAISVDGGEEKRLTTSEALDDGPEYSPDGEYIYFNSTRTGLMELWRMRPDGSNQEQLTDDEFNNWFPHLSPDGKTIVFISYGQDVEPADHPFYKHVYLRKMPVDGGEPEVIAYVYGGQGTINVPSWSPDGTRVAFVSNTTY